MLDQITLQDWINAKNDARGWFGEPPTELSQGELVAARKDMRHAAVVLGMDTGRAHGPARKPRTITRAEFDAKHADYKLTAAQSLDGKTYVMEYDDKYGTCLVPVEIVER